MYAHQGIKFPRYCFFGTTVRLVGSLQRLALPMTVHMSEMVFQRIQRSGLASELVVTPFSVISFAGALLPRR